MARQGRRNPALSAQQCHWRTGHHSMLLPCADLSMNGEGGKGDNHAEMDVE
jgi:hypothetical protein